MATAAPEVRVPGAFATRRRDAWWVAPLVQGLGFLAFAVYATWAGLVGANFIGPTPEGPYLSPLYAPVLFAAPGDTAAYHHAWFGYKPDWLPYPSFIRFSPSVFIILFPLGFRLTCYYYRKFYYRAYFASPPACAVGAITGASYKGEQKGLFWLLNFHRFFLYVALAFIVMLSWDAIQAFRFADGFGIGVGSLIMTGNVLLIMAFTFGCNSLRHIVGGGVDCFSCERGGALKHAAWKGVTVFNERHMFWAWVSMFSMGITDGYIRLCSMGVLRDLRIL